MGDRQGEGRGVVDLVEVRREVDDHRRGAGGRVPEVEVDVGEVAVLVRPGEAEQRGEDLGRPAAGEEVHAEDAVDPGALVDLDVQDADEHLGPDQLGALVGGDGHLVEGDQRDRGGAADAADLDEVEGLVDQGAVAVLVQAQLDGDVGRDERELGAGVQQELAGGGPAVVPGLDGQERQRGEGRQRSAVDLAVVGEVDEPERDAPGMFQAGRRLLGELDADGQVLGVERVGPAAHVQLDDLVDHRRHADDAEGPEEAEADAGVVEQPGVPDGVPDAAPTGVVEPVGGGDVHRGEAGDALLQVVAVVDDPVLLQLRGGEVDDQQARGPGVEQELVEEERPEALIARGPGLVDHLHGHQRLLDGDVVGPAEEGLVPGVEGVVVDLDDPVGHLDHLGDRHPADDLERVDSGPPADQLDLHRPVQAGDVAIEPDRVGAVLGDVDRQVLEVEEREGLAGEGGPDDLEALGVPQPLERQGVGLLGPEQGDPVCPAPPGDGEVRGQGGVEPDGDGVGLGPRVVLIAGGDRERGDAGKRGGDHPRLQRGEPRTAGGQGDAGAGFGNDDPGRSLDQAQLDRQVVRLPGGGGDGQRPARQRDLGGQDAVFQRQEPGRGQGRGHPASPVGGAARGDRLDSRCSGHASRSPFPRAPRATRRSIPIGPGPGPERAGSAVPIGLVLMREGNPGSMMEECGRQMGLNEQSIGIEAAGGGQQKSGRPPNLPGLPRRHRPPNRDRTGPVVVEWAASFRTVGQGKGRRG